MDVQEAVVLAACSFQAYAGLTNMTEPMVVDETCVYMSNCDFQPCRWWLLKPFLDAKLRAVAFIENSQTDTQCWCFANESVLVIAFRGTEIHLTKDVLTDIDLVPVDIEIGKARVHRGFWKAWSSVKVAVEEVVDIFGKNRDVWVAGHSLGGALATLCAFEISQKKRVRLVTFGSPRVGNGEFALEFCTRISENNVVRVTTRGDAVPCVPFSGGAFDYQHVSGAFVLEHGNVAFEEAAEDRARDADGLLADGGVRQHLEAAYFDELTRAVIKI